MQQRRLPDPSCRGARRGVRARVPGALALRRGPGAGHVLARADRNADGPALRRHGRGDPGGRGHPVAAREGQAAHGPAGAPAGLRALPGRRLRDARPQLPGRAARPERAHFDLLRAAGARGGAARLVADRGDGRRPGRAQPPARLRVGAGAARRAVGAAAAAGAAAAGARASRRQARRWWTSALRRRPRRRGRLAASERRAAAAVPVARDPARVAGPQARPRPRGGAVARGRAGRDPDHDPQLRRCSARSCPSRRTAG